MDHMNNYTVELSRIVEQYADEVNTRKNDPVSAERRRKAWTKIHEEYNRLPGVRPRSVLQIRRFIHGRRYRGRKTQTKSETNGEVVSQNDGTTSSESEAEFENANAAQMKNYFGNNQTDAEETSQRPQTEMEMFAKAIDLFNSKTEENKMHQRKMNELAVRREKLQIKLLEQQLEERIMMQSMRSQHERELHNLRKENERHLHEQKLRREEEIHQRRLSLFEMHDIESLANVP